MAGAVKGLGEVNLWVKDLDGMTRFYEELIGLRPIFKNQRHVFLKVAEGYGGHPQSAVMLLKQLITVSVFESIIRHRVCLVT